MPYHARINPRYEIVRDPSRNGLVEHVVVREREPEGEPLFTVRVRFAVLPSFDGRAMPVRALTSWTAVKQSDDPELVEASAAALELANSIARRSNEQPLGLDREVARLKRDETDHYPPHVALDMTDDELAQLHPASADEPLFLYSGVRYDWNLHEPVWGVGRGASVLHDVAQSRLSIVD